jgi:hypothetical protein
VQEHLIYYLGTSTRLSTGKDAGGEGGRDPRRRRWKGTRVEEA